RYDYAQGLLDPERRERFERRFAVSHADRDRLAFAAALVSSLPSTAPEPFLVAPADAKALPVMFQDLGGRLRTAEGVGGALAAVARSAVSRSGALAVAPRFGALPRLTATTSVVTKTRGESQDEVSAGRKGAIWGLLGRIGLGVLGIAVIAVAAIMVVRTIEYQSQVKELKRELSTQRGFGSQNEQEKIRANELARELEIERSRRLMLEEESARHNKQIPPKVEPSPSASFILSPGLTHDSGEMKAPLIQPADAERVRLQLNVKRPDEYQSYEAMLKSADGKPVWGQAGLRPGRFGSIHVIAITLLSRVIPPGRYYVELKGFAPGGLSELVDHYYFSVANR